ncbi:hypothetical protein M7I_5228 [Glarea lozoyensis 74030]|uniref:Nucleoside phosphorylase domain-containing protein n=1 Tax=Glarea lozoyensis (strain ATCC 74030 / MF5533) TaxID=1104152 RepID=H0ERA9_GLAL7|nr:hypothetical protein M7I_5228 [Glarea lozoyensis 74030]
MGVSWDSRGARQRLAKQNAGLEGYEKQKGVYKKRSSQEISWFQIRSLIEQKEIQILTEDYTGIRPFTFFEKGVVGHVGFADPFDAKLGEIVKKCGHSLAGDNIVLHDKGNLICMEGPQFSSRFESNYYRSLGGSVINMSALPEAKLAKEAELAYQMIYFIH